MSPETKKTLALVGAAVYGISPIDFIPDIVPVLCWIDDLIVIVMAIRYKPKQ